MKKIFTTVIMLVFACAASFAQYEDIFANFTVVPADGSSITDRQMSHITFTFPDVHNITIDGNSTYYIYPEAEFDKRGTWGEHTGHYLGEPFVTFLDYEGVCEINDNVVTINIRERIPESGVYYFVIDGGSLWSGQESNEEIAVKYTVEKAGIPFTVTPSNAEPVSLFDLWPFEFTFDGIENVTLKRGFFEMAEAQILDEDGNVVIQTKAYDSNDHWTTEGNKMTLNFYTNQRQEFKKSGKYTLKFTEGSILLDGAPQDEFSIVYDVIVPEHPAEGPVVVEFANYLDEQNRITITLPEYYTASGYANMNNPVYDANDNKVGHLDYVVEDEANRRVWYIPVAFDTEKDENAVYHVSIHEDLLFLNDPYDVYHPSAAKELVFYPNKAAGVSGINADSAKAEYYTVEGIRTAQPQAGKVYIQRANGTAKKIIINK